MGQSQSTNQRNDSGSREEGSSKRDYYELLQLEQNASAEEIKKAYRRKALELHPDRNYGNVEAATALFAEIQSAYEVLSDPQERAWYDSHRSAFLGGDGVTETADYTHNIRMTTSNDILKLFSRFSPQMDFTDSTNGFFGGLREIFSQLALEEQMACRWESMEIIEYPLFGSSKDEWEAVRQFYATWGGFSTKKSFSWKDVHRYSEAPDRRVRRMMEKENKRLREGAIREFNDAVRSLVAFAKKRDPRYKIYRETQSQQQEAIRRSTAAQATRSRAANEAKLRNHIIQDWAKSGDPEEIPSESSEGELEHFECIVCHKSFKSENQFQAHERSKKHIKAVKQLCWEMELEHKELHLGEDLPNQKDAKQDEGLHPNSAEGGEPDAGVQDMSNLEGASDSKERTYSRSACDVTSSANQASVTRTNNAGDVLEYEDGSNYDSRERLEDHLGPRHSADEASGTDSITELSQQMSNSGIGDSYKTLPGTIGKAKQKRAKKAQRAMEQSQEMRCTTCKAPFPSRNKLFAHIKTHHTQPYNSRNK